MYENSTDGVVFATPGGPVRAANPAACALLGMTEEQICRAGREGLLDPDDPRWALGLAKRERTGRTGGRARLRRGDGELREFEVTSRVFREVDGSERSIIIFRDASGPLAVQREVEELRAQLQELSLTDELTGVLNRRGLIVTGTQVLELADRHDSDVQILFVDVDGVAGLNDALGHHAGDTALQAVARALAVTFRRTDVLVRLGGTAFLVLAFSIDEADRETLSERIRRHLAAPETTAFVGAEVGVSLGWVTRRPRDGSSLEKLVARADWAMHEAREASRAVGRPPT